MTALAAALLPAAATPVATALALVDATLIGAARPEPVGGPTAGEYRQLLVELNVLRERPLDGERPQRRAGREMRGRMPL